MSQVILPHKMLRNAIKSKCTTFFSETRTQNQAASIQESSLGPTTKWRRRLCALQLPTAHHSSDLQTLLFFKPSARKALSTSTPTSTFWNFIARCVYALQDTWETLRSSFHTKLSVSLKDACFIQRYTHTPAALHTNTMSFYERQLSSSISTMKQTSSLLLLPRASKPTHAPALLSSWVSPHLSVRFAHRQNISTQEFPSKQRTH